MLGILYPRNVQCFISGGFLAYILNLTKSFDDIDIYLRFDLELLHFFNNMTDKTLLKGENIVWFRGAIRSRKIRENLGKNHVPSDAKSLETKKTCNLLEEENIELKRKYLLKSSIF